LPCLRDSPCHATSRVIASSRHCTVGAADPRFQFLVKSVALCLGPRHHRLHRSADRKPITHSQPSQKGQVAICDDRMRVHVVISKAGHALDRILSQQNSGGCSSFSKSVFDLEAGATCMTVCRSREVASGFKMWRQAAVVSAAAVTLASAQDPTSAWVPNTRSMGVHCYNVSALCDTRSPMQVQLNEARTCWCTQAS
jgi:hypothetical protein